jgi:hypothetical protein
MDDHPSGRHCLYAAPVGSVWLTSARVMSRQGAMMVFGRQDLLREAAALVARARLEEDSQKAADLVKQAADILETLRSSSRMMTRT